jgi:hypothetical protein
MIVLFGFYLNLCVWGCEKFICAYMVVMHAVCWSIFYSFSLGAVHVPINYKLYIFRSSKYEFIYVLQGCGALSFGNWCQMFWEWDMVVVPNHQAPITLWPCATPQQNKILNSTAVKASERHSSDIVPLYLEFPLVRYCMVVLLVYLLTKLSRLQAGLLT